MIAERRDGASRLPGRACVSQAHLALIRAPGRRCRDEHREEMEAIRYGRNKEVSRRGEAEGKRREQKQTQQKQVRKHERQEGGKRLQRVLGFETSSGSVTLRA